MGRKMTLAEMADMLRQDPWFVEHVVFDTTYYEPPDSKAVNPEPEEKAE